MQWLIEDLELEICLHGDNTERINDLKRAISLLKKNSNVFFFPKVMNFQQIEIIKQKTIPPAPPIVVTPVPKQNNNPVMYPGISTQPTAPSPTAPVSINASSLLHNYHEPQVGEQIFGIFKYKDGSSGQCVYTWKEENNPTEIWAYAQGSDNFSTGIRWMPCKKKISDKFLIICTNECCKQPE